jgi:hypothetical protein
MDGTALLEDLDEAEMDDELFSAESDDEAEFLGALGNILNPVGAITNAIGGLINPPRRPPVPTVRPSTPVSGVDTARLTTPNGNATLMLPDKVVTKDEFNQRTQALEAAINRNTARLNTTQTDIRNLGTRVGQVVAQNQRDIARMRAEHRQSLAKFRAQQRAEREKQKARDANARMMNMMMTMMITRQQRQALEDHTHDGDGNAVLEEENQMLMFLPLFMGMGDEGGGSNNAMMFLPLAFM